MSKNIEKRNKNRQGLCETVAAGSLFAYARKNRMVNIPPCGMASMRMG